MILGRRFLSLPMNKTAKPNLVISVVFVFALGLWGGPWGEGWMMCPLGGWWGRTNPKDLVFDDFSVSCLFYKEQSSRAQERVKGRQTDRQTDWLTEGQTHRQTETDRLSKIMFHNFVRLMAKNQAEFDFPEQETWNIRFCLLRNVLKTVTLDFGYLLRQLTPTQIY